MERNRGEKTIALIALVIAVIGLSVGFAAFSNTLTINSNADVTPSASNFDVNFSSTTGTETDGPVVAIPNPDTITGETATIDNTDAPTITGLKAHFTEPGQTVKYKFYSHNAGKYVAYLKSVVFGNVSGESSTKKCTAVGETTQSLVDTACNDITIEVKVASDTFTGSDTVSTGHVLDLDGYEPIEVTISYKTNSEVDVNIADGKFNVEFGPISLVYSSAR